MTRDEAIGWLRLLGDALEEQRVEVELLRRQSERLIEECEALRASLARYGASWTPVLSDLDRLRNHVVRTGAFATAGSPDGDIRTRSL
ncbi:hypothetical protein KAJ83_05065 [Marivibrio halodurans]|uniref:Uncharacterized protein n=1 Tax=Marivibrio halodurans TaxID=2039722 RepID=A0A8J7V038_9PROT|nr:hypothetical protein [Marivibrio halodurans]MBP5856366.1 hypothetical protein [Marivibrio halodurans]